MSIIVECRRDGVIDNSTKADVNNPVPVTIQTIQTIHNEIVF